MSDEKSSEASEATKQITITFLGLALLASVVATYLRPEASQTLIGIGAAIITALAAVVKK